MIKKLNEEFSLDNSLKEFDKEFDFDKILEDLATNRLLRVSLNYYPFFFKSFGRNSNQSPKGDLSILSRGVNALKVMFWIIRHPYTAKKDYTSLIHNMKVIQNYLEKDFSMEDLLEKVAKSKKLSSLFDETTTDEKFRLGLYRLGKGIFKNCVFALPRELRAEYRGQKKFISSKIVEESYREFLEHLERFYLLGKKHDNEPTAEGKRAFQWLQSFVSDYNGKEQLKDLGGKALYPIVYNILYTLNHTQNLDCTSDFFKKFMLLIDKIGQDSNKIASEIGSNRSLFYVGLVESIVNDKNFRNTLSDLLVNDDFFQRIISLSLGVKVEKGALHNIAQILKSEQTLYFDQVEKILNDNKAVIFKILKPYFPNYNQTISSASTKSITKKNQIEESYDRACQVIYDTILASLSNIFKIAQDPNQYKNSNLPINLILILDPLSDKNIVDGYKKNNKRLTDFISPFLTTLEIKLTQEEASKLVSYLHEIVSNPKILDLFQLFNYIAREKLYKDKSQDSKVSFNQALDIILKVVVPLVKVNDKEISQQKSLDTKNNITPDALQKLINLLSSPEMHSPREEVERNQQEQNYPNNDQAIFEEEEDPAVDDPRGSDTIQRIENLMHDFIDPEGATEKDVELWLKSLLEILPYINQGLETIKNEGQSQESNNNSVQQSGYLNKMWSWGKNAAYSAVNKVGNLSWNAFYNYAASRISGDSAYTKNAMRYVRPFLYCLWKGMSNKSGQYISLAQDIGLTISHTIKLLRFSDQSMIIGLIASNPELRQSLKTNIDIIAKLLYESKFLTIEESERLVNNLNLVCDICEKNNSNLQLLMSTILQDNKSREAMIQIMDVIQSISKKSLEFSKGKISHEVSTQYDKMLREKGIIIESKQYSEKKGNKQNTDGLLDLQQICSQFYDNNKENFLFSPLQETINSGNMNGYHFNNIPEQKVMLVNCALNKMNLKNATFNNTKLSNLDIDHSKASEVSFINTTVENSGFGDVKFNGAKFYNTSLQDVIFNDCNFNNVEFNNLELSKTYFEGCQLSNMTFAKVALSHEVVFKDCDFTNSDLSTLTIQGNVKFISCKFNCSKASLTNLEKDQFENCTFDNEYDNSSRDKVSNNIINPPKTPTVNSSQDKSVQQANQNSKPGPRLR